MTVMAALEQYVSPLQQAWTTLGKDMQSGNMVGALDALNTYTSLLPTSNLSMSGWTTPSQTFLNDLDSLGTALKQVQSDTLDALKSPGSQNAAHDQSDLQQAQSIYAAVYFNRPNTADEGLKITIRIASLNAFSTVYAMKYVPGEEVPVATLTANIVTIDTLLREKNADISGALVSLGYSQSDATKYADAITGISNKDDAGNAETDQERADKWIKGIVELGYKARASRPDAFDAKEVKNDLDSLLYEVLFSSAEKGRQLQILLDATTNGDSSEGSYSSSASGTKGKLINAIA